SGFDEVRYWEFSSGVTINMTDPSQSKDVLINVEAVTGTNFDDVIIGSSGNDTLHGLAGNDSLVGGAGDDNIFAGAGNDTIDGGAGFDVAYYWEFSSG